MENRYLDSSKIIEGIRGVLLVSGKVSCISLKWWISGNMGIADLQMFCNSWKFTAVSRVAELVYFPSREKHTHHFFHEILERHRITQIAWRFQKVCCHSLLVIKDRKTWKQKSIEVALGDLQKNMVFMVNNIDNTRAFAKDRVTHAIIFKGREKKQQNRKYQTKKNHFGVSNEPMFENVTPNK